MATAADNSAVAGGTPLDGVRLRRLRPNRDQRGAFTEIFSDAWNIGIQPAQWSIVQSQAGVLRGMHLHNRHDEYFLVVHGRAAVGLHDLRTNSPTAGKWALYEFSAAQPTLICFPPGIVHGWYFHEDSIHVQAVSETYEDYRHDDNSGCRWDDPELGIKWPCTAPILSEEAAGFGSLAELRKRINN